MQIRHVEIGDDIASKHPELWEQYPQLCQPFPAHLGEWVSDFPFFFYALEHGKIASYFRSFPDVLHWNNRQLKWAWNGDLFTDAAFRGRGLAQSVVQYQVEEFARRNIVWGGVFSSPIALRIYGRLGFTMMGHVRRFCLFRDIRPFVKHHTNNKLIIAASGLAGDVAASATRLVRQSLRGFQRTHKIDAIELEQFASLVDRLVQPKNFYWGRSFNWFRARIAERGIDRLYFVRRDGDAEPCAFLILRDRTFRHRILMSRYSNIRVMSLMEFGQFDEGNDLEAVIFNGALALFEDSEAALLEVITSSPRIQAMARSAAFLPFGVGMSFKFMPPLNSALCKIKTNLSDWHLTQYSGDAFGLE